MSNNFFEDFSRVTGGAFKAFSGAKAEMDQLMRQQFETFCASMKLVTREEFEVLEGMLAKSREAEENLVERVALLEEEVNRLRGGKKTAAKPEKSDAAPATDAKAE